MARSELMHSPEAAPGAAHHQARSELPPGAAVTKAAAEDLLFSALALALWCITSAKSALASPLLAHHNLQSLAGAAAIAVAGLAWPAVAPRSYIRWRVPALASLRFLLLALPYNFEEGLWDDVFPGAAASHRLAWALNLSNLAVGTGMVMLVLTALGWRLPLRAHMALQALLVGLWVHFGVGPHCRSKLLTNDYTAAVGAVYSAGEMGIAVLVPIASRPPGGPRTQAAAVLLFGWLVVGWLLPTLLLLQPQARSASARRRRSQQRQSGRRGVAARCLAALGSALAWLEGHLLTGLRSLRSTRVPAEPPAGQQAVQYRDMPPDDLPAALQLLLRWVTVLLPLWMACRTLAPMYAAEGVPLSVHI
ncbi:hypothetical protein ABPG75_004015 [Micractinium tetrahymenae]